MDVAELKRQVEYKFAPEPLLAVQALANTFAFESGEERLLDPAAARRWLSESDLVGRSTKVSAEEFNRLRTFRTAVRRSIESNGAREPVDPPTASLSGFAAAHAVRLQAGPDGTLALDLRPAKCVDEVIAQFIGIVFEAQRLEQWARLKICASDECRWAFYDSSRNRGGTWCQMEICGNRVKNRAYRRRRAEA